MSTSPVTVVKGPVCVGHDLYFPLLLVFIGEDVGIVCEGRGWGEPGRPWTPP